MKKAISIAGGVFGFLFAVVAYVLVMEVVFESDRLSTKLGGVIAIGGALAGSSLADLITRRGREKQGQHAGSTADDLARQERLWKAVLDVDLDEIEGLRDVIQPVDVAPLAARWESSHPWPQKEALIALLTDQTAEKHPEIESLLRDGLAAPTFEVRLYAYCSLTGDFAGFTEILEGGDSFLQEKLKERDV